MSRREGGADLGSFSFVVNSIAWTLETTLMLFIGIVPLSDLDGGAWL